MSENVQILDYPVFNLCIETHDDIAIICSPKVHIYYILKDINPENIESEIKKIEMKILKDSEEYNSEITDDIRDYVHYQICNINEIIQNQPFYVPPVHFQDNSKKISVFENTYDLIDTDVNMDGCRNWNDRKIYECLNVLLNDNSWKMEYSSVIKVENDKDYERILDLITRSKTKKRIEIKFYTDENVRNSSKKYYDTNIRDEIMMEFIRIHNYQYYIDEDNFIIPEHPPENDFDYKSFPISIRLKRIHEKQ